MPSFDIGNSVDINTNINTYVDHVLHDIVTEKLLYPFVTVTMVEGQALLHFKIRVVTTTIEQSLLIGW